MFAEGSEYQEEIHAVGPKGKISCKVPGPTRFWPKHMSEPPVPHLILSPRSPMAPSRVDTVVPSELLSAGDHNGSTFYQHQKFQAAILDQKLPEVPSIWSSQMKQLLFPIFSDSIIFQETKESMIFLWIQIQLPYWLQAMVFLK